MNKLMKIKVQREMKLMRKSALECDKALEVALSEFERYKKMGLSFTDQDIETFKKVRRFVQDMDRFMGALEQQLHK